MNPPRSPFVPWPAGLELVLASRSPRRSELLRTAGLPFVIIPAPEVEADLAATLDHLHHRPAEYAETLAAAKAHAVGERHPAKLVLGADTIVVLDGDILEKPVDRADAVRLLGRLSGRRHTVITAIALCGGPAGLPPVRRHARTEVEFLTLEPAAIERYVDSGEPMDKAGAYGIQGLGALMVRGVRGCYFNVMGLPLALLGETMRELFTRQTSG
ncbi:septum formation protein Maf [bacterium DOLJORAL78_65_58]|nr:MAG: septum formation protein Maf [bacterium DOLZORAL124_64_63]PIE75960.1 MAG: septum formation protein Maf [bacterium DOLJORAL78_65_58]